MVIVNTIHSQRTGLCVVSCFLDVYHKAIGHEVYIYIYIVFVTHAVVSKETGIY